MVPINLYFPYLQDAQKWAKENGIDIVYDSNIRKWCCKKRYEHLFQMVQRNGGEYIAYQLKGGVYFHDIDTGYETDETEN